MTRQVFLSYAHRDLAKARKLFKSLSTSAEIYVWFDKEDLLPGMKWRPAIRKAIRESRYFIALMSTKSVSGPGFRNSELRQALDVVREFPDDRVFLIPTRLDDCEPPIDELKEYNYADLFPEWDEGMRRLRKAIRVKEPEATGIRPGKRSMISMPASSAQPPDRPLSAKDYHYQVGLVDLKSNTPILRSVADGLNAIQSYFYFKASEQAASRKAILSVEGSPHLDIEQLSAQFYKKIGKMDIDHLVCFTNRFLTFEEDGYQYLRYLGVGSPVDERIAFISVRDLAYYAEQSLVPYHVALAYSLVSEMVSYFLDVDYHNTLRACPMDNTQVHEQMVPGLGKGEFCAPCSKKLEKNKPLKAAVEAMLRWQRK